MIVNLICQNLLRTWTKDQWLLLSILGSTHLFNGLVVSLQAPFYPAEAELKGANASQYGLVFGIFELTVFLASPMIGKYLPRLGLSKTFCIGMTLTGASCVTFGFLFYIEDSTLFILLSMVVRMLQALGNAAFLTASFSMVAHRFSNEVATVFALVEMLFSLGIIFGPMVGAALFQHGGYSFPFSVLGGILLGQGLLSALVLSRLEFVTSEASEEADRGIFQALVIPRVLIATLAVFSASMSINFLMGTLERHLSTVFQLSPVQVGFFFMAFGLAYGVPNPFLGWLSDHISPRIVILVGSLLPAVGFTFLGPVPFTGLAATRDLTLAMVVVIGIGVGAQLVAAFKEAQMSAVRRGFPNDLSTFALISSLWTSAFALGAFVGPTVAGLLFDYVGFGWSTLFAGSVSLLVFLLTAYSLTRLCVDNYKRRKAEKYYSELHEDSKRRTIPKVDPESSGGAGPSRAADTGRRVKNPKLTVTISNGGEEPLYKPNGAFIVTPTGMRYTPTRTLFTPTGIVFPAPEQGNQKSD